MFQSDSSLATESVRIVSEDGTARPPVGELLYNSSTCGHWAPLELLALMCPAH